MGLRIVDALRLSWSNVVGHRGRSAAVVITVVILFGLVMGVNMILEGLEKTLLEVSVEKTGGKVYVETSFQKSRYGKNEVRLAERLEKYHGRKIGILRTWQFPGMQVEAVSLDETEVEEADFAEMSEVTYVGSAMRLPEGNWLGLLTSGVYGNTAGDWPLMVDDGTGKIEVYIAEKTQLERTKKVVNLDEMLQMMGTEEDGDVQEYTEEDIAYWYEEARNWKPEERETTIAVFENYEDAKRYALTRDTPEAKNLEPQAFVVSDLFSNTVGVAETFNYYWMTLRFFEIVLLVVAVVVAVLSFAHLVDSDAATVTLYRLMGASTGEIYLVYGLYLLELCLLAVVGCVMMALGIVGIVTAVNVEGLATGVQEFYGLTEEPRVGLLGFGSGFWRVILLIILVAPLTLVLTTRRFAAKHTAKKLKEEG